MRSSIFILLITSLILLQACGRDLEVPKRNIKKKIVLVGELVAGENAKIRLGQSIPISADDELKFAVVNGANMTISNGTNSAVLSSKEDSLTSVLFTLPFTGDYRIEPGNNYSITAVHQELGTANVNVFVPSAFVATIPAYNTNDYFNADSVIKFDVRINDIDEENFYAIECLKQDMNIVGYFYANGQWLNITYNKAQYNDLIDKGAKPAERYDTIYYNNYTRVPLFTDDANTTNLTNSDVTNSFRRILLPDVSFRSSSYLTKVAVSKAYLQSLAKGRLIVQVKSISRDYYNYLSIYEGTADVPFNSLSVTPNKTGNVKGGVGIVGGVYKHSFAFIFDVWDF